MAGYLFLLREVLYEKKRAFFVRMYAILLMKNTFGTGHFKPHC